MAGLHVDLGIHEARIPFGVRGDVGGAGGAVAPAADEVDDGDGDRVVAGLAVGARGAADGVGLDEVAAVGVDDDFGGFGGGAVAPVDGGGVAAGGVEAIYTIKALQTGVIPPTINLENPGEGCDLDYVPNTAREAKVDVAVSNGFGFGGTNGTLVFKRI